MRLLTAFALVVLLAFPVGTLAGARSGGSHSSSHSSSKSSSSKSSSSKGSSSKGSSSKGSSSKSDASGKVHVKGYTKKDGTYVAPHDRSAPGSHSSGSTSSTHSPSGTSNYCTTCPRDKNGHIKRSEKARDDFMRSTGYPKGRKGYVVDHIVPLECGGADAPSNMQWQTKEAAKAKDKTEHDCRR